MLATHTPLVGGANHRYSEALYLQDPEGNGIEIYHDQPLEDWDIRDNGEIIGVTEELNTNLLVEGATLLEQLPKGTRIGHMHLQAKSIGDNRHFYQQLLNFDQKRQISNSALFMADGLYHHQLATNTWAGRNISTHQSGELGLESYTIFKADLVTIKANFLAATWDFAETENQLITVDPNGVQVKIKQL